MTVRRVDPVVRCSYCGLAIRRGTRHRWFTWADGRKPVHQTCYHRLTAGDGCGCDLCTGDIH